MPGNDKPRGGGSTKRDPRKCDHLPGENNEFVRNITYGHVIVDGERVALGGYIERCIKCGDERPILVG
jgi:hypothetical protein